jgi:hypothetical protein
MPIVDAGWMITQSPGGDGGTNTASLRFGTAQTISAQASLTGFGHGDDGGVGEVGFSAIVRNGQYQPIGSDVFGSWWHTIIADGITQIDLSSRSWSGWVDGGAIIHHWS